MTAQRFREAGWWPDTTLDDQLFRHMRERPQQEAIVDPPNRAEIDGQPPARLTWADFGDAVSRLTAALARNGIGADDVLVAQMANTWEIIALYFAAARLGAIVSPVPTQYRERDVGYVVEHVRARALIVTPRIGRHDFTAMASAIAKAASIRLFTIGDSSESGIDLTAEMEKDVGEYTAVSPAHADDIVCLCWTSGSEGRPKGVARSHSQWLAIAPMIVESANLQPGCRILNGRPVVTIGAMTATLSPWLQLGGTLVNHHPFSLDVFIDQIFNEAIDFTGCAPAMLVKMAEHPAMQSRRDLGRLRTISSGSAQLPAHLIRLYRDRFGVDLLNVFGSTEGTMLASTPQDMPNPEDRAAYFPRYGADRCWQLSLAQGIESLLKDPETGKLIEVPGKPGELHHRGPFTFLGYFNAPELSEAAFDTEGFARTGDLFEIAGDRQQYYRFVGRLKDIIVRGGMNISTAEVEALVVSHPAVLEVAAVGVPDAALGEKVAIAVVFRDGATASLAEINTFLREACGIALFKQPEHLIGLEALPRTAVGKVDKIALRKMVADGVYATGPRA
ncbi:MULTISPECIES: class I adenylate-forming enzyme family protein [unclassified Beijerinckia]|uniref:class I adenylate-forming enzyme family protein n=1 Tax=unclassified Beijerinckia TaxID=2638183 RepID=UPI00147C26FB|nr:MULTISPECIES: class I adenylate-forming enzyme family protein [unclassified Beijerinckia]